jgi:hypothetical protein
LFAGVSTAHALRLSALLATLVAGLGSGPALAQSCNPGSTAVSGTLAAPHSCPPPVAKAKPQHKKSPPPEGFWSGVRIGGSVSTTTTIRGR